MVGIKIGEREMGDARRDYLRFVAYISPHVVKAVEGSFAQAHTINLTRALVVERTNMAWDIVKQCRFDLKWSKFQIAGRLPVMLLRKLLGQDPISADEQRDREHKDKFKETAGGSDRARDAGTAVYQVDPGSLAAQQELEKQASAGLQKGLDEQFGSDEQDMADDGGDGTIRSVETE